MPQPRYWVYAAATAIYILNAWGAYVTAGNYGGSCGGGAGGINSWPFCNGQLAPNFGDYGAVIEYIHRTISVVTGLILLTATVVVWRAKPRPRGPSRLMILSLVLLPIQIGIGSQVVESGLNAVITTVHFAFATGIFALVVIAGALLYLEESRLVSSQAKPETDRPKNFPWTET